jgi:hypothetical protein
MEYWADKGWVHCRQTPIRRWRILWADRDEVRRLEKLRARTTPKKRKEW